MARKPLPSGGLEPPEDIIMAASKKKRSYTGLPKKTYWHLYSLQGLQSEKLARIVNKVLKREYVLIK